MAVGSTDARVAAHAEFPEMYAKLKEIEKPLSATLGEVLTGLVRLRASYINGCAFCIDMHTREALKQGEDQRRLFVLAAWHEARDHFTEAEQAALSLVDAVTRLGEHGVPDEVHAEAAAHFTQRELSALLLATAMMNLWNRIAIGSGMRPPARG